MTPPKGPAERAAEEIYNALLVDEGYNRDTIELVAAIIGGNYASIEQENDKLRSQLETWAVRARAHQQAAEFSELAAKKGEHENQRLREAAAEMDVALGVAHDMMVTWYSSEYANDPKAKLVSAARDKYRHALATDKRG